MTSQHIPRLLIRAFPAQGYFVPASLIFLWLRMGRGAQAWKYAIQNRN